ncbi:MAG: indole-3-glycerol phosphate synthase [Myxococcota bacterium]|jgi:indole-3-glycerol phosphate synthase
MSLAPDVAPVLKRIVDGTRARLAATPVDMDALTRAAMERVAPPDAFAALAAPGIRVIAEVKRRSPSEGAIRADADPVAQATLYATHGAAAISILTEPDHFGGRLADLEAVAAAVSAPCLRKDFIVGKRQILEARHAGASLVLLIVGVVEDTALRTLREDAEAMGMHALVEAHTADEVRRAADSGATIIGVNNRNLHTFEVDLAVGEQLRPLIPDHALAVAESGIYTRADVDRLRHAGYSKFLVGTALMRSNDPGAALVDLIGDPG